MISKNFARRVVREGIVDTKKYRYVTKEETDGIAIYRIPVEMLDTTVALGDWELVGIVK